MRFEVFYKDPSLDGRATRLQRQVHEHVSASISNCMIVDVYLLDGPHGLTEARGAEIFADRVIEDVLVDEGLAGSLLNNEWNILIEVRYKAGVTNPVAITARQAVEEELGVRLSHDCIIQTARQYLIEMDNISEGVVGELKSFLHNPLIQQTVFISRDKWLNSERPPAVYPHISDTKPQKVETFQVAELEIDRFLELSDSRLLALNREELLAIQEYFRSPTTEKKRIEKGLPREATDVELEMIAQTWSEHCKHKIFNADIIYRDGETIETIRSLFNLYIKGTTEALASSCTFLRSVFYDNSGVIEFDEETLICFKAETHNSPSALDPYGGAITGIVGVNRDIIGTGLGAKPVFNTNVLCFGEPDTPENSLPKGLLHPRRVMEGVHHGIIDGGNQSGIPVVGGAFLFDPSFTGKPLVFCGTGGILPAKIGEIDGWTKEIRAGDLAVMAGGRIGKDGIHGATFSSTVLDEESPTSAVQIGDPITQKKMLDFILEARDRELYRGLTDNGAGGLSSSLGEMAEYSGGVRIDLHACPLKYEGLSCWEILVSESQERMSLAVPPDKIDSFLDLAGRRGVEAAVIGEFTKTGSVDIFDGSRIVGSLDLEFLHKGVPVMQLEAEWKAPDRGTTIDKEFSEEGLKNNLIALLREPNIASKETLVRQYDHEVQAGSVVKPFVGRDSDAPSDGAVIKLKYDSMRGIVVTHGICPRVSDLDSYHMAMCAVDEAYRAYIACGGNPGIAAALDNFCWPDPVYSDENPDGRYKLAQLVRACRGLQEACLAYNLPLISGKDSMKNDARLEGKKVSVRPTLLISLMGIIDDIGKAMTTDFKIIGDSIYLAGETRDELGGSMFEKINQCCFPGCPSVDTVSALKLYHKIHTCIERGFIRSCHDLADGGLGVALAESVLGMKGGAEIDLEHVPVNRSAAESGPSVLLFSETPSRFLLSVSPDTEAAFEEIIKDLPVEKIGKVTGSDVMTVNHGDKKLMSVSIGELERAWKRTFE
jgi:phosphoribosylformylglycinamidine synthase subunit PurSL